MAQPGKALDCYLVPDGTGKHPVLERVRGFKSPSPRLLSSHGQRRYKVIMRRYTAHEAVWYIVRDPQCSARSDLHGPRRYDLSGNGDLPYDGRVELDQFVLFHGVHDNDGRLRGPSAVYGDFSTRDGVVCSCWCVHRVRLVRDNRCIIHQTRRGRCSQGSSGRLKADLRISFRDRCDGRSVYHKHSFIIRTMDFSLENEGKWVISRCSIRMRWTHDVCIQNRINMCYV